MNQEADNTNNPQQGQSDELNNDSSDVGTNTTNVVKEVIDGITDKVAAAENSVAQDDVELGKVDVEGTHDMNKEANNNPTTSDGQSKSEPTSNSQPLEDTIMDDKESDNQDAESAVKSSSVAAANDVANLGGEEEHNQTTKDSTEDGKDDMEVDEINTDEKNKEEESDNNSLPRKNSSDLKSEALALELAKPERRASKRQRANRSPQNTGSAPKKIKSNITSNGGTRSM